MIAEDNKVKLKIAAINLQYEIESLCNDGFERSMALAKVEEALFWSGKCIISGMENLKDILNNTPETERGGK